MVAGCGANIAKMTLFVFNFMVWLVGIALITVGTLALTKDKYGAIFGDDTNTLKVVSGVVIGVGCFIFILAFAGCCGAIKESSCLLKMYIGILIILVILEIVGGILAFVFRGDIQNVLEETMTKQIQEEYDPSNANLKYIVDFYDLFQNESKCCGALDYSTYNQSVWRTKNPTKNQFVPESCCQVESASCGDANAGGTDIFDSTLIYTTGCSATIVTFFEDNFLYIGISALALIVFELVALLFAGCVVSNIDNGIDA